MWDRAVITGVSREAVERFFHYVLNANVDTEAFRERVVAQQSKNLTELAMTLADRFRQEGRQEGEIQSRQQSLLELLEARFGTLPEELSEMLSSLSDLNRLKALQRTAATCPELEVFISSL